MNLLKLPPFKDDQTMRDRVLYAIESGAGFELSWTSNKFTKFNQDRQNAQPLRISGPCFEQRARRYETRELRWLCLGFARVLWCSCLWMSSLKHPQQVLASVFARSLTALIHCRSPDLLQFAYYYKLHMPIVYYFILEPFKPRIVFPKLS